MKNAIFFAVLFALFFTETKAQLISSTKTNFDLSTATIVVDKNDFILVKKSAELLQQDIEAVTGKKIPIENSYNISTKNNIIIGSVTNSAFVKAIVANVKLLAASLNNKWETYHIETVQNTLLIMGSDRRGTAYGVFELSKKIGVSPWYWWADVPVKKQSSIYINTKEIISDAPKVKYRGIFINDEAPAFSGWTKEKFGGVNHQVYEKIFELILRLKGNYLWPAMWGNAFNEDGTMRKSVFLQKLGDDFVTDAFRIAQASAPNTELYYNDYNNEQPAKRAGCIALIKKIQAAGVRIDGVGIQGHWHLGKMPLKDIEESIVQYSALGLKVMITELDIEVLKRDFQGADVGQRMRADSTTNPYKNGLPDSIQQKLASDYKALFQLFLKYKDNVTRVTFWGVNDAQSWLNGWPVPGRTNYPLLFDRNFKPKPAFYSVMGLKK